MEILIIAIVAFVAALLTFFSGFGLGTILTPVMLVFFPPEIAISLTGIVHFCNNIFKLSIIGKQFNKEVLIKFGIPAILFAFVGSYALFFISNDTLFTYNLLGNNMNVSYLQFIIAIILIAFALIDLIPFFKKLKFNKSILPLGGILSGFFGGLTGNQGALRSAFLMEMLFWEMLDCNPKRNDTMMLKLHLVKTIICEGTNYEVLLCYMILHFHT